MSASAATMQRQQAQYEQAFASGGYKGIEDLLISQGFSKEEIPQQLERIKTLSPEFYNRIMMEAENAAAKKDIEFMQEQQQRYLDSVLPNSEIQPQSVADRLLDEYLFSSREGAVIDDKGNMTDKGTLSPGLNVPQGTLPTPVSIISPGIDPGTRDQMAFMQQARPGADGNFGAATPTQPRNVGTPPSNGAYYGGQLAPPPPEGYQTGSLLGRQNTSNQLQGQPMTNDQTQSGQSGYGSTNNLSSPNK